MPREELLSVDEIARLARLAAAFGISRIRITGGEPSVHPDLTAIISAVAQTGVHVAMTTNGSRMDPGWLAAWKDAGLARLTISIDAAEPETFARITRSKTTPDDLVRGIRAARDIGLWPVKLNSVILRGINDCQVVPLAALARELGVEMRYIEFMPLDSGHRWDRSTVVTAAEMLRAINAAFPLIADGREDKSDTALRFRFADGAPGGIGMIAPVSQPFCGACSRLRITADGKVRPCLFSTTEWDLRPLLRSGADDAALRRFLVDATWTKQAGHGIGLAGFEPPERTMSAIGG
jgi:cyclic pyranopterin phosphate synthase